VALAGSSSKSTGYSPVSANTRPDAEAYSASAAQFLQDLPSYVLRAPIYLAFLILASGLAYSCVGRVQSKVAAGLVVEGEEYVLESPVPGDVSYIEVGEGDVVQRQAPLVTLFAPASVADASELARMGTDRAEARSSLADLRSAYTELIRITGVLAARAPALRVGDYPPLLTVPPDLAADSVAGETPAARGRVLRYAALVESYRARQSAVAGDYLRARAELARVQARQKQNADLFARRVISEPDYAASQQELARGSSQVEQLSNQFKASFHTAISDMLTERDRIVDRLRATEASIERVRLASADVEVDRQQVRLRSRYPGVVTHVLVRPLQPVAPGTELVRIQRADVPKQGVVLVPNAAIGKVAVGQRVYVKFAAYPYQEYGVQTGRVVSISPEQEAVEGLGLGYEARVDFDAVRKGVTLRYGMQGIAEIATGKRRIIEMILPPTEKIFAAFGG